MILRSIGAVLAGYILMAVLVMTASTVLVVAFPGTFAMDDGRPQLPGLGWYGLSLVYSFVFAVAGGHTCARIARRAEMAHVIALATLFAALGLGGMLLGAEGVPVWRTSGFVAVGVLGVLAGGFIRAQAGAAAA